MSELSNEELLEGLGVEVKTKTKSSLTPRQERIIAGFEDIQRFVEEHGHAPSPLPHLLLCDEFRRPSARVEGSTSIFHELIEFSRGLTFFNGGDIQIGRDHAMLAPLVDL